MGEFAKWLLHQDQKEFFDYLFAIVLNAVFLVLIALLLWPSCYVACVIVSAFYMGALYKFANLILAIGSFIVFSLWPAAGNAMYGWFFELFDPGKWSIWWP